MSGPKVTLNYLIPFLSPPLESLSHVHQLQAAYLHRQIVDRVQQSTFILYGVLISEEDVGGH